MCVCVCVCVCVCFVLFFFVVVFFSLVILCDLDQVSGKGKKKENMMSAQFIFNEFGST